jgi:hypothetical protein
MFLSASLPSSLHSRTQYNLQGLLRSCGVFNVLFNNTVFTEMFTYCRMLWRNDYVGLRWIAKASRAWGCGIFQNARSTSGFSLKLVWSFLYPYLWLCASTSHLVECILDVAVGYMSQSAMIGQIHWNYFNYDDMDLQTWRKYKFMFSTSEIKIKYLSEWLSLLKGIH